jgi:thiosulfate/3-mercaptopyruvate sulfurtransferase
LYDNSVEEDMSNYSHPEVLVSTDWVKSKIGAPDVRIVEAGVDAQAYEVGHIPGAIGFSWETQLQDQVMRDIISKPAFEQLMSDSGISNNNTVVLYGDNSNWFAAYAFWLFKLYGHKDVRLMNGGRNKWLDESDKPLTPDIPRIIPTRYKASGPDPTIRARVAEVLEASQRHAAQLVDVRDPDEFTGRVIAPPGLIETAQRSGHIPGAKNIPWSAAVNSDGTFKSRVELEALYLNGADLKPDGETITYCRIGERSSHSWFVLKYLLGFSMVKNYDGSWTEYGSMIGMPIER